MTTNPEAAPMTAEEFRARIGEIAPLDFEGTAPVGARDLARFMALQAQRRWTRNLSDYFEGPPGMPAFHESIGTMCSEFAALHLLMALISIGKRAPGDARPTVAELAGEAATQIRDAWDDGGRIGEWLYEHGQALGIDHAEIDRLEYAWQALPEVQAAREASAAPLRTPERIPLDIALAALTKLASEAPVAVNGAPEADARRRLAARAIEDVKAVAGEARTEEGAQR